MSRSRSNTDKEQTHFHKISEKIIHSKIGQSGLTIMKSPNPDGERKGVKGQVTKIYIYIFISNKRSFITTNRQSLATESIQRYYLKGDDRWDTLRQRVNYQ